MAEEHRLMNEMLRALAANTVVGAAFFGAVGGLTSALAINVDRKALVRQIVMGALVAGSMGSGAGAIISAWLGIDWALVPAGGATGMASYLTGVFGPAIIEVILGRIRSGRMPNESAAAAARKKEEDP